MSNAPPGGEFLEPGGITIVDTDTQFKVVCHRAITEQETEWLRREFDAWLKTLAPKIVMYEA